MERTEVIAEQEAAGVLARVSACVLALWCLPIAVMTLLHGFNAVHSSSLEPDQDRALLASATTLLPLALGIALFTRGFRVVQWCAGRALRQQARPAPGSCWVAVGLPVLALSLLPRSLYGVATSLQWDTRDDSSLLYLSGDLVSIAFAVSILLAAPALTRAWSRWNTPRAP